MQRFRHITVPLLTPTTVFLLVTTFIASMKVFQSVDVMTGGGPGKATTVISILAYRESFSYYHFGEASAMSIVLCLINFVLTVMYVKAVKYEL